LQPGTVLVLKKDASGMTCYLEAILAHVILEACPAAGQGTLFRTSTVLEMKKDSYGMTASFCT
jgi:hypothetical protein